MRLENMIKKEHKKIIGAFILITSFLSLAVWLGGFDDYLRCLDENQIPGGECFTNYLMRSPPIKDTIELAEACNETDIGCGTEITKRVIEDKVME